MKKMNREEKQKGFTIIEMVASIVVSAILAIGIVDFIGNSVEGIASSASRNQLASSGRIAIDRLSMELHNALPNSIRATTATAGGDQCLEFIPVRGATIYINPPLTGAGTTFDVVDFIPDQQGATDGYAVIYPRNIDQIYDGDNGASAGWPNFPSRRPIQEISSIADSASDDQSTITLIKPHRFRRASPNRRFFIVDDPVSYCVSGDKLYRYTNYGFYTSQVTAEEEAGVCEVASDDRCLPNYDAAPGKVIITDSIDNTGLTAFAVGTQTLTRNSLVSIELNFVNDGDSIILNHDVLSRSVP